MNRETFDTIKHLLRKHLQEGLTPEEQQQLDTWINASGDNRRLFHELSNPEEFEQAYRRFLHSRERILAALYQQIPALKNNTRVVRLPYWRWAAAVLLVLCMGAYLWLSHNKETRPSAVVAHTDILPGRSGAILTLSDGSSVALDSLDNQVVASQNGAQVRLKNGGLTYTPSGKATDELSYNTITTPRGRQFRLSLPDGTKAWLNAASSITYPTIFKGKERRVKVTGEVYFEVEKNTAMPFHVNVNDQAEIAVLGTRFNINGYTNEISINATLLDGAIRVTTDKETSVKLSPGEQAQVAGHEITVDDQVDIEKVMAWKNGIFNFNGVHLQEAMRQLERWYDIEVVYEKGVPDITFLGKITKGVPLNGLLTGLEGAGVHFRVEGRKLIVLP